MATKRWTATNEANNSDAEMVGLLAIPLLVILKSQGASSWEIRSENQADFTVSRP